MFSKTNLPGDSSKFDADSAKRVAAIKNMALKVTKIHCFGCTRLFWACKQNIVIMGLLMEFAITRFPGEGGEGKEGFQANYSQ